MNSQALARKLKRCHTERDLWPLKIAAETALTPRELVALLEERARLPPVTAAWLKSFAAMAGIPGGTAKPFTRRSVAAHVQLFSDPAIPSSGKCLVIGFTGIAGRLMLPAAAILQRLQADTIDLVLVNDPSRTHYLNGVEGYADSFPGLVAALGRDLNPESYSDFVCIGASLGGFAALRCAIALQARRGVSIGGRFPTYVRRLIKEERIVAFDPLCDCNAGTPCELVVALGDDPGDAADATRLMRTIPVKQLSYPGMPGHNLMFEILKRGELESFLAHLLQPDSVQDNL